MINNEQQPSGSKHVIQRARFGRHWRSKRFLAVAYFFPRNLILFLNRIGELLPTLQQQIGL